MDIIYNAAAAERLIHQMDKHCTGVQKEAKELLALLTNPGEWQDNQMRAFQANTMEIAKDLNRMLALEGEYMRTLYRKMMELRGN